MYKAKAGLVNGDIVKDLLDLCNEFFVDPMIQQYAGARRECMYCGGMTNHSADCPEIKYKNICEKHSSGIKQGP